MQIALHILSYRYKNERSVAFNAPPDTLVGWRGDTPPHIPPHSARTHLRRSPCVPPEVQPDLRLWSDDSFWKPWRKKIIFAHPVYLQGIRSKFAYKGHEVKFTVTEAKKVRKSVFPQCKTLIAHNSCSIKDTATRFAYVTGFLNMADRMVWLPSLSRDRKWPRVTKCTHSRLVGLRLKGNLVVGRFGAVLGDWKTCYSKLHWPATGTAWLWRSELT